MTATPVTHEIRNAALVPNVVLECGGLVTPQDVQRFDKTAFAWRGGNNGADLPFVELQQLTGEDPGSDDSWSTVLNAEGFELHLHMRVYRLQPTDPIVPGSPGCNELLDQMYSVVFEPSFDFPTGTYRFVSTGVFRTAPTVDEAYRATSQPFEVTPGELSMSARLDGGDLRVDLDYPVDPEGVRFRPRDTVGGWARVMYDGQDYMATFDAVTADLIVAGLNPSPGETITVVEGEDPWGNRAMSGPTITAS